MTSEEVERVLDGLPPLRPPAALRAKVLDALARRSSRPRRRPFLRWEAALVAASLALFAGVVATVIRRLAPATSPSPAAPRLPFAEEWTYTFTDAKVDRLTLLGPQLFVETSDRKLIALDRFSGKAEWAFRLPDGSKLDQRPEVNLERIVQIRRLESELSTLSRKLEDALREKGPGPETQELQKKRSERREHLRAEAGADAVFLASGKEIHCLDRTSGRLNWTRQLNFQPGGPLAASGWSLYIPRTDPPGVVGLTLESKGARQAEYRTLDAEPVSTRPAPDWSHLLFASGRKVYCYDVDTSMKFFYPLGGDLRGEPAAVLYVTPAGRPKRTEWILWVGDSTGVIHAVSGFAGSHLWKYSCGADVRGQPAVKDDTVYVSTADGALLAFEVLPQDPDVARRRDPNLRWKLSGANRFVLKAGDRAYLLAPGDELVAVEELTGKVVRRHRIPGLLHCPTNTTDGRLYIATEGGKLSCLTEKEK